MATFYSNITGSTGVDIELLAPGVHESGIKSILLTNTHGSADATVSLFIQKLSTDATASETYYMLSTVAIPADTSLLLDNPSMLSFNNLIYGLYLTVGSSDTLDVIINGE